MGTEAPPTWREDLQAVAPAVDATGATWRGNLNATHPWRSIVGDIELANGQRLILKYHTQLDKWQREWAATQLLQELGPPKLAPTYLGGNAERRVLVFERLKGRDLPEFLTGEHAEPVWREAARLVGQLHQRTATLTDCWLELCPHNAMASRLPVYDLPLASLVRPFEQTGPIDPRLPEAILVAQQTLTDPGPWLSFTHADLQTRHFILTDVGMRMVDWEGAGLYHRLYDVACLIEKPILHGLDLPAWAEDVVVAEYAAVCGLDPNAVRRELAPILLYERLIGVAEDYPANSDGMRVTLPRILKLVDRAPQFAVIGTAAALLARLTKPQTTQRG